MKDKKVLEMVIDIAKNEHQASQRQTAQAERLLNQALETEQMLKNYRLEQRSTKGLKQGSTTTTQQLLVQQRFGDKLDHAIDQQATQVNQQQSLVDASQVKTKAAAIRLRSIERLVTLRRAKQAQRLNKLEQVQTDERANQMAHRRRSA